MEEKLQEKYKESLKFWNRELQSSEEDYADIDAGTDWRNLESETLCAIFDQITNLDNVLDYGCGSGWADVYLIKNGSDRITAVDVSENGIASAKLYAKAFGVEDRIEHKVVQTDWLEHQAEEIYHNAICINVIDVVPDEVSDSIIANLRRVCKKGGQVIVGMNPYFEKEMFSNRDNFVFDGAYMYVDGILRLNNHTDEEWIKRMEKYFTIEKTEYYRMNQEKEGVKRRLFFLRACLP